jgi:hypothetical protein
VKNGLRSASVSTSIRFARLKVSLAAVSLFFIILVLFFVNAVLRSEYFSKKMKCSCTHSLLLSTLAVRKLCFQRPMYLPSIITVHGLNDQGSIPSSTLDFSLRHNIYTGCRAQRTSCSMDTGGGGGVSSGVKWLKRDVNLCFVRFQKVVHC